MKKTKVKKINKKMNKKIKKTKVKKAKNKKLKKVIKKINKKLSKKITTKKLTVGEKKTQELSRLSNELIVKGHKRGFVTYDEILKTFPDIENNIFFLDELYEKFTVAGIDVLEGGNLLNLDADVNDDLNESTMHDSIQMYLKEIGQYP
ncbi:MAG: RNA polymerase sigma factor region1.1 domain-containing protein [bacterium]